MIWFSVPLSETPCIIDKYKLKGYTSIIDTKYQTCDSIIQHFEISSEDWKNMIGRNCFYIPLLK